MPRIDAVAVVSTDMKKTVAFYALLGFDFDGVDISADHVEPNLPEGATRLMIDTADLMERLTGHRGAPASHSGFGLLCDSPAEVDSMAEAVSAAGFDVVTAPWDAFWGQRYATVKDPDGYQTDLFAPLD